MPCLKILTGTHAVSRMPRLRRNEREYRPFPNETGRNTRQVSAGLPCPHGSNPVGTVNDTRDRLRMESMGLVSKAIGWAST